MNKKITIILDFDYTLLDSFKFKKEAFNVLEKHGLSSKLVEDSYEKIVARNSWGYGCYNPDWHLKYLVKKGIKVDYRRARKELWQVVRNCKKHLYPDTLWFLKKLKKDRYRLVLLTRGDRKFQGDKLKGTGIGKYFDQVIITLNSKYKHFAPIVKNSKMTFYVDDNVGEITGVDKHFPEVTTIIKDKPKKPLEKKYQSKYPHFLDLKRTYNYINDKANSTKIVILAAGKGERMKSSKPKVLIPLKGKPLIKHLLKVVKVTGVDSKPTLVIGQQANLVRKTLGSGYHYVYQNKQLGTGHAVKVTREDLEGKFKNILVLYGDHPLMKASTIKNLVNLHNKSQATLTLLTTRLPVGSKWQEYAQSYGRIIRKGGKIKIKEAKDCTLQEKRIAEFNPGYYCFNASWLWENLEKLNNKNKQKEFYLTALIGMAQNQGEKLAVKRINFKESLGVNTQEQLELVEGLLKK